MKRFTIIIIAALAALAALGADRDSTLTLRADSLALSLSTDTLTLTLPKAERSLYDNIYAKPYTLTGNVHPKWGRLWANTGVLVGAYVTTLFVLECLPQDATAWNRAEIHNVPLFKRWRNHVITQGPEWDHDKFLFNYVLHPYAGAVYFMSARSCGFGFWQSMLYSTIISTVGWEFGIEAFMERPSYQDLFITPIVGSCVGELFYRVKRTIVSHDYTLGGSKVLGNIVVFLVDPLNEVLNLMRGSDTRRMHLGRRESRRLESSFIPVGAGGAPGFTLSVTF